MDNTLKKRKKARERRVLRVRKKLQGSAERPRLSVFKSNCHLYVQLIDDRAGKTLAATSTLEKSSKKAQHKSKECARALGEKIAEIAKKNKIESVIFDRGRYKYHGIIAALAEEVRKAGLQF